MEDYVNAEGDTHHEKTRKKKKEKHSDKTKVISDEEVSHVSENNKRKRKHKDKLSELDHTDKDVIEDNSKLNETEGPSDIETDKQKRKKCKKEKKSHKDSSDDLECHKSIEHDSGLDIEEKNNENLDSITEVKKKKSKTDKDKSIENAATKDAEKVTSSEEKVHDDVDPEEDPEKAAIRKKKREKRHQKKLEALKIKQEREARIGTAKASAIEYLNQWDKKRSEWKFMKVRQVWCLQNMFDTDQVSEDTFEILLRYLKPLSGSAKTSTLTNAEKMIQQSEEETSEEGEMTVKADRARQIIQLLSD